MYRTAICLDIHYKFGYSDFYFICICYWNLLYVYLYDKIHFVCCIFDIDLSEICTEKLVYQMSDCHFMLCTWTVVTGMYAGNLSKAILIMTYVSSIYISILLCNCDVISTGQ